MKVLSISTDRKLFEENSAVFIRSIEYAKKMEELHIVVFSQKNQKLNNKSVGNLHIYPTNSDSRLVYILDAFKIAKQIILKNGLNKGYFAISAQDPFETGLVGYKLKKKFNIPLQIQIHTDVFSSHFKNSFLNKIRVVLAKFLIPKADALRVVSSVISDSIKYKFPNLNIPVYVLPVFVDTNVFSSQLDQSRSLKTDFPQFDHFVFMNSRLSPEKCVDTAIKSFKKVLGKYPKVGLIVSGAGQEKNNLKIFSQQLGIEKNVVFTGWTNSSEIIANYYKSADLFLLTSEFEGYGMTLVEAGVSGCPIVTTKVGIAKINLFKDGENSFVCPVGDVNCLSNRIIELISSPPKRELFKQRMQDSIKSILVSKEEHTTQYVSLLEKLIK